MASFSSETDSDQHSAGSDGNSISADVSESESSSTFSYDPRAGPFSSANFDLPAPPLPVPGVRHVIMPADKLKNPVTGDTELSVIELMKERFAKLLLGEDMSGEGKGVCTALAISNAITNLSATVFGELWKLGPMAPQNKLMWHREMECLLSVSDSIVELFPSLQEFPGGGTFEVMATRQRADLHLNLPALKKLDAMLISMIDGFHEAEFYYVDRGVVIAGGENFEARSSPSSGRPSIRLEEKWWLPFPKVPANGLSIATRKRLQKCRECTNQIFKAAMAINSSVLADMEIPTNYLESLPKKGKACLGEILHRYISDGQFSPECLLDYLDQCSEYAKLEIANRIEASVHVWRQRSLKRHVKHGKPVRSAWRGKAKGLVAGAEKSVLFAERAESLLQSLKLRFPGLPQTALDMNKIQYNKDVGQSILESYSRVLESLAFNIMTRIEDLLHVDDATKQRAAASQSLAILGQRGCSSGLPVHKKIITPPFSVKLDSCDSPSKKTRFSSSKHKHEGPTTIYCSANKNSLWESLDENFEKLTL